MNYVFNAEIARKFGVNEAIFIQHLYWWQEKNKADNRNFYTTEISRPNGEKTQVSGYWTYNSMKSFTEIFPFWTHRQIQTIIESCRAKEIIYTTQLNRKKYDKTLWYLLSEPVAEMLNAISENVKPIPVNKPVIEEYISKNKIPKNKYIYSSSSQIFAGDPAGQVRLQSFSENLRNSHANRKIHGNEAKKVFEADSEPYLLAKFLEQNIAANNPKFPQSEQQRQRWAKDIDLMLRRDKIEADDIAAVMQWCQKDKFWCSNILSGKKLRDKYQQLRIRMTADRR